MSRLLAAALLAAGVASAPGVAAQTQDGGAPPAFEVASVKPSSGDSRFGIRLDPDKYAVSRVPLRFLIQDAYSVNEFQISRAPAWVANDFWDVVAKSQDRFSVERRKAMLRTLLAQRFQLQVRWESRKMPVYALVVDKSGPKLRAPKPDETFQLYVTPRPRGVRMVGRRATMQSLAKMLGDLLYRTVLDKTGLSGEYDFQTEWTPDERETVGMEMIQAQREAPAGDDSTLPADAPGLSLAAALRERMGLKLETTKGPVEILVVDRVEKPPGN